MGAVVTAMSGALFTMLTGSAIQRQRTLLETELRKYSEAVRAAPYEPCATTSDYNRPPGYTPDSGLSNADTKVTYLSFWRQPAAGANPDLGAFNFLHDLSSLATNGKCTVDEPNDDGMQLVWLQVRDTKGGTLSTTVVKRRTQ